MSWATEDGASMSMTVVRNIHLDGSSRRSFVVETGRTERRLTSGTKDCSLTESPRDKGCKL